MKKLYIVVSVLILAACESPPVRRDELIAQHPEWDDRTVKIIAQGYLVQGMSAEQVKAAWGRPCWVCTGTVKDKTSGTWRAWEYQTQIVFFDENERVLRWTQK